MAWSRLAETRVVLFLLGPGIRLHGWWCCQRTAGKGSTTSSCGWYWIPWHFDLGVHHLRGCITKLSIGNGSVPVQKSIIKLVFNQKTAEQILDTSTETKILGMTLANNTCDLQTFFVAQTVQHMLTVNIQLAQKPIFFFCSTLSQLTDCIRLEGTDNSKDIISGFFILHACSAATAGAATTGITICFTPQFWKNFACQENRLQFPMCFFF